MRLLLDTHIWVWYSLGDTQLSVNLQDSIATPSTELWLSPISLWEVMILVAKGKISLQSDPADWIAQSTAELQTIEAPLNNRIAVLSRQLDLPHQDPADRFIAATAIHYQLQLATVDTNLIAAKWLPTVS